MTDIVGKLPGWLPRRLWMLAHECDLVSPRDFIDACIHGSVVAAADALRQAAERIKELERERQEAADEIERLREELDTWNAVFPDIAPEHVQPDRSLLEKEIERKARDLLKQTGDEG